MYKCLFIGDSISAAFPNSILPQHISIENFAVSGNSTVETLAILAPDWFKNQPDYVFVCIGTNDIARDRSDAFIVDRITKIIRQTQEFAPNAMVVLTSVFPTRDNEPRPNARIDVLNSTLEQLAQELPVAFLNLNVHFKDEDNQLKSNFTEDTLHLTPKAYVLWADLLQLFLEA